jgi:hypothetical protein
MRYTTVTVDVDVDLSEFDTEDLQEELAQRGVMLPATGPLTDDEASRRLETIHQLMRMGKKDNAYELMYDYIRDVLGTAI